MPPTFYQRFARSFVFALLIALAGACARPRPAATASVARHEAAGASAASSAALADLDARYERLRAFVGDAMYGPGGQVVLRVAHETLREKHARGEVPLVGLEDLWAHALQEGLALFNRPDALWGRTTAEETADMIGQTTIGPWQMTIANVRDVYGPSYGVDPKWSEAEIYAFCRERPGVQAGMIADFIELSYELYGRRSPYAIQRYFWLDPFVRGEIGQSADWTKSVVARPPAGGSWKDLTPEAKADTGFYAKQVLLGTGYTNTGLLFWLHVAGDDEGVRETLRVWRDQPRLAVPGESAVGAKAGDYVVTAEPGGFGVRPDDVRYYVGFPERRAAIEALIREVAAEKE